MANKSVSKNVQKNILRNFRSIKSYFITYKILESKFGHHSIHHNIIHRRRCNIGFTIPTILPCSLSCFLFRSSKTINGWVIRTFPEPRV